MMLRTYIACRVDQDDEQVLQEANKLRDTIRCFATSLSKFAFWDAKSAGTKNCIVVYGNNAELEEGMQIKCDDIDNVVTQWCKDIANCLRDLCEDNPSNLYVVEITEANYDGGLHLTCTSKCKDQPYTLWILPIKKGAGDDS